MRDKYYHTKESVEEYIKMAKDVNSIQLIEKLKQFLPEKSTLLELGSGPGTDWKLMNEYFQITGSDNSKEFLHYLNTKFPNGEFIDLDAIKLTVDKSYDGIYSNKVLHHFSDAELKESIQNQAKILHRGGVICHSFWLGEGSEVFKGMFVNYQDSKSLTELFRDLFNIIELASYKEFEDDDSIVLIGRIK